MTSSQGTKKIAILGGGIGALTAAWYLTDRPGWQNEYEVTVYQLGWRLGGKGATGRQAEKNHRILEHGLHVWFGWYENAFRTLRSVYKQLDRAPGRGITTVEQAFTPRQDCQMLERVGDGWLPWNLDFPLKDGIPGESRIDSFGWDVVVTIIDWIVLQAEEFLGKKPAASHPRPEHLGDKFLALLHDATGGVTEAITRTSLHAAQHWIKALEPGAEAARETGAHDVHHDWIAKLLRHFRDWMNEVLDDAVRNDTELRRTWIVLDLTLTGLIGFLEDRIYAKGLSAIDDYELSDWLRQRGASEMTIRSVPVRALYDCFFGYRDGDVAQRYIAAGAGLGCALRIGVTYRGSVLYLMNAGMGEVIVAPMYEVLARRGVKVEFFRKVQRIEPAADGTSIERVRLGIQATVKDPPYKPLYTVNDLPVWPDHPFWDQLQEGRYLEEHGIDLESHWAKWDGVGEQVLERGKDFDIVIQGISLAGVGEICRPLAEVNERWREMLDKIPSMQTFGVQLWLEKSLAELGWEGPPRPAVAAPELMDVWADMSQTIRSEDYDYRRMPRSVVYLCGPLPGDLLHRFAPSQHDTPEKARQQVSSIAVEWLQRYPGWIWPKSVGPGPGKGLDWDLLFADSGVKGAERLQEQFLRANIDPTERYVLAPPKWNKLRMHPGQSGFDNLILAGDWTWNAVNAGCVEAATISGMLASRVLTGYPEKIAGENFMVG
jgi:uncharacterized protein with NAD-binding domain and iron-sulfur cluster